MRLWYSGAMNGITEKVERALRASAQLHREQVRKDEKATPYIAHPVAVAWIISEYTNDEDTICGALLHDVLEDVPGYGEARMREDFGDRVTEIVKGVSEEKDPNEPVENHLPWKERKVRYLENLKGSGDESVLVSLGDKIHNTSGLLELMDQEIFFREKFGSSMDERLWFTRSVADIGKERGFDTLSKKLNGLINEAEEKVKNLSHNKTK